MVGRQGESDRLAKALTHLGRAIKTIHILRYLHDSQLRQRIQLHLNRGESRNQLAKRIFFANQGTFRNGDYEDIMNKVSALAVLSNAVLGSTSRREGDPDRHVGVVVGPQESPSQPQNAELQGEAVSLAFATAAAHLFKVTGTE